MIKQYGGHIAQYLGVMVYFGYPKGLEHAPRAAVHAGLEILEAVQKANKEWIDLGRSEIDIRLGIHTGLVVIDHQLQLALGDTVNIAARLEGLAPVNGLVISPQKNKLVQGWFEVNSIGYHQLIISSSGGLTPRSVSRNSFLVHCNRSKFTIHRIVIPSQRGI